MAVYIFATTAGNVHHLEQQIQELYQLALYTIPLLIAVIGTIIAGYFKLRQTAQLARQNHATLTTQILPGIEETQASVTTGHKEIMGAMNGAGNNNAGDQTANSGRSGNH